MLRGTFFLTLAALLVVAPRAAAQAPVVTRIACVGEHSTDSGRVENPLEYPARLQALLGDAYQVAEFGFGTASLTKTGFPTTKYADSPEYAASLAFAPDIVIVGPWGRGDAVGTVHIDDGANNNVYLYEQATPLVAADFQSALEQLIAAYQALPAKPAVLVALPLPFPYGTGKGHVADIILPVTQTLATARNLPLLDLWQPFLGLRAEFEDADHLSPSPGGMDHMAQVVFAAVQAHAGNTPAGGGTGGTGGTGAVAGAPSSGGSAGASSAGGASEMPALGGSPGLPSSGAAGVGQDPAPGPGATSSSNTGSGSSGNSSSCKVGHAPKASSGLLIGCLLALLGIARRRRPVA